VRLSGEKLRSLRLARLWSQQNLADAAGMTESTVNRLENGLQTARLSTIRRLAAALDVEPPALLDERETDKKRAQDES
jgi:transcriptional regulator with XRE-family HTH domain